MRKLIALFMILTTVVTAFTSCASSDNKNGNPANNGESGLPSDPDGSEDGGEYVFNYGENTAISPGWYYKIAREVQEDGWVWTFQYYDLKDPNNDANVQHYSFYGFNMRYKYDEDYIQKIVREPEDPSKGGTFTEIIYPTRLTSGKGPAARDNDMINSILDNDRTVEELLALNPDDYEFSYIDKEMFFRLMRQALTGERHKEGNDQAYWEKQVYDLMIEPGYLSGYKFQFAYMNGAGCIDEFYIDILYQTGTGYTDYVQLSDLVENGTATDEQIEAFAKFLEIAENIKEQDSYFANAEDWKNLEIAGIEFSRLYTMLDRLYWNQESIYREDPRIDIVEGIA